MVHWQFFLWGSEFLSPSVKADCWNVPLQVLISLSIWILDCLSLTHIVEIRMNSLSVLFRDSSSSSCFSRKRFEFWAHANSLDYLDCSDGALAIFIEGSKCLSHPWRQLLELALVQISLTIWISDCLSLAHIVEIRMNSLSVLFQDRSSSSYFSRKLFDFWSHANSLNYLDCSHCALAVFYLRKQIPLPISKGSCWNSPLQVLISLTIWISDCLSLAHIVEIRMNLLSVLFGDRSSTSYFVRKLFEFWAHANSFYYLDCSHAALAIFREGSKFLSPSMKAIVGTCPCANFLDHLDFILIIFGSHCWIQDEFTVSVISWQKFIFLFFKKCVQILSSCDFWGFANSLDHLNCSDGTPAVFYLMKQISPINEGSCWNLTLCKFAWPFVFQIVYLWLT